MPPTDLWRVHVGKYSAKQFHPGGSGNARFSPISDSGGKAIPTLYAASSVEAALMETVFHDVPTPPGDYILDLARLDEELICISVIRSIRSLLLVDLSTKGLQRLGLKRVDLIDTPVRAYRLTRDWAAWFHRVSPKAQGLLWTSRKDDDAKSLMLFGDRVRAKSLTVVKPAQPVTGVWQDVVLDVALHIGIDKVISPRN
jgi:RES domain